MSTVQRNAPLLDAEKQILGVTHPQVGAFLLGLWGLPDTVVEAVALHHADDIENPTHVCRAVIVAVAIKKFEDEHHDYDRLVGSLSHLATASDIDRWLELAKTA